MSTPAPRTDFYTGFHKGLRRRLFETTVLAGATDVTDAAARARLGGSLDELFAWLRVHARLEDTHMHPLLAAAAPDVLARLERDHAQHEQHVVELEQQLARVREAPADAHEVSLALYRALNRFLAAYLEHLDAEEA